MIPPKQLTRTQHQLGLVRCTNMLQTTAHHNVLSIITAIVIEFKMRKYLPNTSRRVDTSVLFTDFTCVSTWVIFGRNSVSDFCWIELEEMYKLLQRSYEKRVIWSTWLACPRSNGSTPDSEHTPRWTMQGLACKYLWRLSCWGLELSANRFHHRHTLKGCVIYSSSPHLRSSSARAKSFDEAK